MVPENSYGGIARALHWAVAALVLVLILLGLGMEELPRGPMRSTARMLHEGLGVAALALATLRLCWALLHAGPAPLGNAWQRGLARSGHAALYVMTLAVPLSGLARNWARGRAVNLFGYAWQPPFPVPGGRIWGEVHEALAWGLVALVAVHLAAVAWHVLIRRDGTLRRMIGRPSDASRAT